MTPPEAETAIKEALGEVTPGADTDSLPADADLRDTLELDSIDFLRFVEILSERTGERIDEDDYPQLATVASAVKFLTGRAPS
jgi:acyl carrier protein